MSNQKSPFEPSKNDTSRDFDFQRLSEPRQEADGSFYTHHYLDEQASNDDDLEQVSAIQPFLHLPSRQKPDADDQQSGLKQFQVQQSPRPQERPEPILPQLTLQIQPPRRHRMLNPFMAIAFIALILLIVAGSVIEQRLGTSASTQSQSSNSAPQTGSFVQQPLSAQQIDDLRHIADRMNDQQLAYLDVQNMNLDEEIGQVLMVGYPENSYSPELDTMIHNLHAGAVILFQHQINTQAQTKADTAEMQKRADMPLLISTDEEGGLVQRLSDVFPSSPSAYQIGQSTPQFAAQQGTQTAKELLTLGINTNLAPDVDVSASTGYIGSQQRSFGDTSADVIAYAGPYIKAMQTDGAIATLKHFPGLGGASAVANPHEVFVTVNHTQQQVNTIDLAPFKQFINATDKMEQPGLIMATDELMPSIDPTYIAELSPTFITKILRQQLGYQGVAITDDLTMLGVQVNGKHIALPQAGVMALQAGDDMVLGAYNVASMESMIQAIKDALKNGSLSKSRLDEAATRVLTLKIERNLIPTASN